LNFPHLKISADFSRAITDAHQAFTEKSINIFQHKKTEAWRTCFIAGAPSLCLFIYTTSKIIQHIPSYAVESHLRRLGDLTKDGGLLIINTNVSNKSDEYFIKGAIKEDKAEEVEIGADEFNRLTQCVGELPVHMFDRDTICNLMC
jgi:hypothetical protein